MRKIQSFIVVFFTSFLALVCSTDAFAQKIGVYVDGVAQDALGRSLIAEVRRAIPKSALLGVSSSIEESDLVVRITTLDPQDTSGLKLTTVYSLVLNVRTNGGPSRELYGSSFIGRCGLSSLDDCASEVTREAERFLGQLGALRR